MVIVVNGKVTAEPSSARKVMGITQGGMGITQGGMGPNNGLGLINYIPKQKPPVDPNVALSGTNKSILKSLGIDLDTVLTPKGKRKKKAGLAGGQPGELENELG